MKFRSALLAACLTAGAVMLSGCGALYQAPVQPPHGFLYSQYKHPLTVDFDQTPTGPNVKSSSESATSYLRLWWFEFAWDDAAIAEIAKEGGISEVSYAELEILNVIGIYRQYKVTVYGN